jgi:hypothetical protein
VNPTTAKSAVFSARTLIPRRGSPVAVAGVGLLGDRPLEAALAHLLVEVLAPLLDVVRVAQGAGGRQHPPEDRLARLERKRSEVEVLEAEEVEDEERRRALHHGSLDVGAPRELHPLLELLEAGPALLAEHHHLAVQDHRLEGERSGGPGDLLERCGGVASAPVDEARLPLDPRGEEAEAVVLELEEPEDSIYRSTDAWHSFITFALRRAA